MKNWLVITMYEPPIKTTVSDFEMKFIKERERNIYRAVQKYDIHVDKEELIKALNYDRQQYQKGFDDGYRSFAADFYCKLMEYSPDSKGNTLIRMKDIIGILNYVKAGE